MTGAGWTFSLRQHSSLLIMAFWDSSMTNEKKIQNMGYIPEGAMYHWFFIKCTQAAGIQSLSIMNE